MEVTLDLRPDLTAPATARTAVDRLAGALSPAVAADLRLLVSELVTNAVIHGPRHRTVTLRLVVAGEDRVSGEVADQGDGLVQIRESAGEGGGWGLRLLDRMADRWGVHQGSTHVWFELSGSRGPAR